MIITFFACVDSIPTLIGLINFLLDIILDIFNLIYTVINRIYLYRLLITRTNDYFIVLIFQIMFQCIFSIFIDSIIYIGIILCRIFSNIYWIISTCFFLFRGSRRTSSVSRRTSSISVYNSGRSPPIKYKEVPNNTLAAPILNLRILNLCLTAVTIRFLIVLSFFQF